MDEQLDLYPVEISEMFIDGFCLGARMVIEIYQNKFPNMADKECIKQKKRRHTQRRHLFLFKRYFI